MSDTEKQGKRGRKALPPGVAKVRRSIAINSAIWDAAISLLPSVSAECERALKRAIKREEKKRKGKG